MSDNANFNRLSTYVGGIVDRKIKAISMAITGSGSYLRTLTLQTQTYTNQALGHVNTASGHASDAASAAASSLIVYNNFTSSYLGVSSTEPQVSQLGNPILPGAFYIRSTDNRLRVCRSVASNGTPSYVDATVQADLTSLSGAGAGIFLSLLTTSSQTVLGPISFQQTILVPRVTSWTSQQPTTAVDVNEQIVSLQGNITAETNRAVAAETAINNTRVAKIGDTMSGALVVSSTSEASSVTVRNTTNGSGRQFRLNSTNSGNFRIVDDTSSVERLTITGTGAVTVNGSFQTTGNVTSPTITVNNSPSTDPVFNIQTSNITRWSIGRAAASSRFYIARMNSSGVFIDTPISVSETDGSVTLNKVNLNDGISVKGDIRNDSVSASIILNNTSGTNDTRVVFSHLSATRWTIARSAATGSLVVGRFNNTGTYLDIPLSISDTTGNVTINALNVTTSIQAASLSSGQITTTASGTGRNVQIGDDVWIGDSNILNGMSIRGINDFNQGYLRFGNSSLSLGCSGDSVLKYGNDVVVHAGNINSMFEYGSNSNGFWERRRNGVVEVWGMKTVVGNNSNVMSFEIPFPIQFSSEIQNIQLTVSGPARPGWNPLTIQYTNHTTSGLSVILDTTDPDVRMINSITVNYRVLGR